MKPELIDSENRWPRKWLQLGVVALAIAGIFAILLVLARTPQIKAAFGEQLFNVALVVHVDLSVLVWFLAMLGMGLSRHLTQQNALQFPYLQGSAFYSMALGTALIALSPLHSQWQVIKSNYIPVIMNPPFFLGLSLIFCAILLLAAAVFLHSIRHAKKLCGEAIIWPLTSFILLLALGLFWHSALALPGNIAKADSYEFLFWAGGHILQFGFTIIAMLAWLALLGQLRANMRLSAWAYNFAAAIIVFGAIYPLPQYFSLGVDSEIARQSFTRAMIIFGGLIPGIFIIWAVAQLLRKTAIYKGRNAAFSALIMSLLVFSSGGILGLLIKGQNVIIPAHYHGSIVGITIALMGYAYILMPQFGGRNVLAMRSAYWQPIILGIGQLLHVGGLAYSGGYGVLRKQAAAGIAYAPDVKIALGFMGLGGLLAIIGGLMFVIVMWRAMYGRFE